MSRLSPKLAEWLTLGLLCSLLIGLAWVSPIAQSQAYHHFADARSLTIGSWVIPCAADVLSNLAFIAAGLAGLLWFSRAPAAQQLPLGFFFVGLVLTGMGSAAYHAAPSDATLLWDRLPMVLAFAGAVGALGTERLGAAIGARWLLAWLYLGSVSVAIWAGADDLRLYAVVQFGGLGLLLLWAAVPARDGALSLPWRWLLVGYAAAKVLEHFDRGIWVLTQGLVSGHPLKHVAAAAGAIPLLYVLRRQPE